MKIGIDASGIFGWRGPSRNIRNILRHIIHEDTDNTYVLFVPNEPTLELQGDNFKWQVVPKTKAVPWLNISLPLAVFREKIDVMLFPQANFWLWKFVPTVIMTRAAYIGHIEAGFIEDLSAVLKRWRFKHVAQRVLSVSHFNATQIRLSCGMPGEKFITIYNGVDPVFMDPAIEPCGKYGKYILFVGGTDERKNIKRVLEAFLTLRRKGFKENLVLAGGVYAGVGETLESFATGFQEMKDHIIIHGVESDSRVLAGIYKGASVVVYPSIQEDFGLISVEAMAAGVPLVASTMPSIPEIAGDAAEYFDAFDSAEMADKIEKVLTNPQRAGELVTLGYERIKRYDWNRSARKIADVLDSVARGVLPPGNSIKDDKRG